MPELTDIEGGNALPPVAGQEPAPPLSPAPASTTAPAAYDLTGFPLRTTRGRIAALPPDLKRQYWVRRDFADTSVSDEGILDGLEYERTRPKPSLRQRLNVWEATKTSPMFQFGIGLGEGLVNTVRKARGAPPIDLGAPPSRDIFSQVARGIGGGLTGPLDPADPLVAAGMAFPPGGAIERGISQAMGQGPALAGTYIREGRLAAATSRFVPDAARLRVAGIKPVSGAAPAPIQTAATKVPPAVAQHLAQAAAIVERDKPGNITKALYSIPGIKQVVGQLEPALKLDPAVTAAWVAQGRAEATTATKFALARRSQVTALENVFGKNATRVRDYKPVGVAFRGTAEQAKYPWVNTLADILARPSLYDLTPEQQAAIASVQKARSYTFNAVKDAYGLDIGEYQVKEGLFLPNVDVSEDVVKAAGGRQAALSRGRAKTRFYATAADRWAHDSTFEPETTVRDLLATDDRTLSSMAGHQTFVLGSGGKTRLEVIAETHPQLAAKMTGLKRRLGNLRSYVRQVDAQAADAVDTFLSSPLETDDILDLQAGIALKPGRYLSKKSPLVGMTGHDLRKEIAGVQAQITALQPSWRAANPKPYVLVQEGVYRYFPGEEAPQVRTLLERSKSRFLRYVDELRATAFGGDLSPVSIQGLTDWLADPVAASKSYQAQGFKALSEEALVADMRANPESWQRFTEFTGINPLGGVDQEFGTGFLSRIPKVGKAWESWNESLYRPIMRRQKDLFEASYQGGLKRGLTPEAAGAVAADDATKLIPRVDYRRLGQSQAQAARHRAVLTSVSFLTQPAALMNDAAKGIVKIGLKQTITPNERFAAQRVLTLAATTEAIAIASNVWHAKRHGLNEEQAIKDSLDPGSGKFMSLVLPTGGKIGLGGPYRSIIRAIAPQEIKLSGIEKPVPLPFAGIPNFFQNKVGPAGRLGLEEAQNRDYWGNQIRGQEFPLNVLQGLAYALQGTAPLTVGTALEEGRKGAPLNEVGTQVAGQFAGTSYQPETLAQLKDRVAVQMYPIDPIKEPQRQAEPYLGLETGQREKVRQDPLVKAQMDAQTEYKGKTAEATRAAQEQFHDDLKSLNDAADAAYSDLAQRREDTALGKLTGPRALSPLAFREKLKETASTRRLATMALVKGMEKFAKEHPEADYDELNPDSVNREKFFAQYNNFDLLDPSTGGWDYQTRNEIKAAWERQYDKATVQRWLQASNEDAPRLVRRWWDGLETYRPYFEVQDELLQGQTQQVQNWVKAINEAEIMRQEPGLAEALRRKAPPEVDDFVKAVAKIRKAMRADKTGRFAGLDRWLFDYGYTPSTLAEQASRKAR